MGFSSHSAVLVAMGARVEQIDPTPFQQNLAETWEEAISAFAASPEDLPDARAHLGYVVFLTSSRPADSERQIRGGDGSVGMEVESFVDVAWTYRIRVDTQMADYRKALDSTEAVVRAILGEDWSAEASARCIDAAIPLQLEGEPWLLLRTSFLVSYEIGA